MVRDSRLIEKTSQLIRFRIRFADVWLTRCLNYSKLEIVCWQILPSSVPLGLLFRTTTMAVRQSMKFTPTISPEAYPL